MERSGGGGGGGREAGQISKQFTAEIPILLGLSEVRQSAGFITGETWSICPSHPCILSYYWSITEERTEMLSCLLGHQLLENCDKAR